MPRPARDGDHAGARGGTERGEQRRALLVRAAASILQERGFDALSHRAVAARAGLPLAATTYYFASLDDLVAAAVQVFGEPYLKHARRVMQALPPPPQPASVVAGLVVSLVAGPEQDAGTASLLTFYERYVQAGRHPRLRPLVRAWTDELERLSADVLRRYLGEDAAMLAPQVVALVDGLLLGALVDSDEQAPTRAAVGVAALLSRLAPARPHAGDASGG